MPFDFSRLEEDIQLEPHNPNWNEWYKGEVALLASIFQPSMPAFEHVGSSAVEGLLSKPIVDILVGLENFELPHGMIREIERAGYEYFGQLHPDQERLFARKRGKKSFNLQIVPIASRDWVEKIAFRNYLRMHPKAIQKYAEVKQKAIAAGNGRLLGYHRYKDPVVSELLAAALEWYSNSDKR